MDYRREGEVYANTLAPGRHLYGGWFHFRGIIVEGPDLRLTSENNSAQLTELFSISFTTGYAPSIFADLQRTVQIEIETTLPWLLADVPEPD
ncbi:MAG: hypothetical protein EOO57_07175 [Hymenobacter sp.]|nr:MAG: hypothetical protein EOO57_07175 [Hymenobacter sp.]